MVKTGRCTCAGDNQALFVQFVLLVVFVATFAQQDNPQLRASRTVELHKWRGVLSWQTQTNQPSTANVDQIRQLPIQLQLSEKQQRLMADPVKAGNDCLMLQSFMGVNKTADKLTDYRQLLRV